MERDRSKHSPKVTPEQYRVMLKRKLAGDKAQMGSDEQVIGDIEANNLEAVNGMPSDMLGQDMTQNPMQQVANNRASSSAPISMKLGIIPGMPQPRNAPAGASFGKIMDMMPSWKQASEPGRDPMNQQLIERLMQRGQQDPMAEIAQQRAALPQGPAPPDIDAILRGLYGRAQQQ